MIMLQRKFEHNHSFHKGITVALNALAIADVDVKNNVVLLDGRPRAENNAVARPKDGCVLDGNESQPGCQRCS
jgi:hypothetical protein